MFEHFLSKTQNDCALRAQNPNARAGKKEGGWGGRNFCPPSLSAAAEFRISLCEMRRKKI